MLTGTFDALGNFHGQPILFQGTPWIDAGHFGQGNGFPAVRPVGPLGERGAEEEEHVIGRQRKV